MKKLFLTSSVNVVIDDIVSKLDDTVGRKLVYVITASEYETEDLQWCEDNRKALVNTGFDVTDYTFTGKTKNEIKKDLSEYDFMCIEGGNTFYLLQKIQETDCANVIRKFVNEGKPYIGSSAGSVIVGPDIYPLRHLDEAPQMDDYTGLGLVDFVVFPHWGSDIFRNLYLNKRLEINYKDDHKRMFLTDNQYLYIEGDCMKFIDVKLDKK